MKKIIFLTTLIFFTITSLKSQTKYVFIGTNTTYWFDASNWQNNIMPPVLGSTSTIPTMDTVLLKTQTLINTAHTVRNNGVLIIGDPIEFSFLSMDEIGRFDNNGVLTILENAFLDTDDGGEINLNNGSKTEIMGSLAKQQFGTLRIRLGSQVIISGDGMLEIF